ncbi:hypothetical protein Unana1_03502 [Umbelopsis nana]
MVCKSDMFELQATLDLEQQLDTGIAAKPVAVGPERLQVDAMVEQPWAINSNVSYGFAAANIAGLTEADWCCTCYALTFTSGAVAGKQFVVQITNTGGDLGGNQFDLEIPGGGVGIYNGCTPQWNSPANGWGDRYGGVSSASDCSQLPAVLQPGCQWRFGWFQNADNPTVNFQQVQCPTELTSRTGCART